MIPIEDFLADLVQQGIRVWRVGDNLRIRAEKGAITPALHGQLKARKAEILAFLHESSGDDRESGDLIEPFTGAGPPALSFAQQRLWFLHQLGGADPANIQYNMPLAIQFDGRLDAGTLERSLAAIVRRHEVLRTTFGSRRGVPFQIVQPWRPDILTFLDLSWVSGPEKLALSLANLSARMVFDLEQGPLFRFWLLRLTQTRQVLLLNFHHIVTDGWSVDIFAREMTAHYEAFSSARNDPLPEPSIQYKDFAQWQRQWFQGKVLKAELAYWKRRLGGDLPLLNLPVDFPRGNPPATEGSRCYLQLNRELSQGLRTLARRRETTLFMTLLAAFHLLLSRFSGQQDICVGIPIAGRNRHQTETLIGFFVNMLVLRCDLSGNPTFSALLPRVRQVATEAYDHQNTPFEKLVDELQPDRQGGQTPLFQVVFTFQEAPGDEAKFNLASHALGKTTPNLASRIFGKPLDSAKFDLTLMVVNDPGCLQAYLQYRKCLFHELTIRRLGRHFETILVEIIERPSIPLADLALIPSAERFRLLHEWNQPIPERARGSITASFRREVIQQADATALCLDGQFLTYGKLDRLASRTALLIKARGAGSGDLVGVCMERSPAMVACLLGILRVGAAYVPLDPRTSPSRRAYILADADLSLVLVEPSWAQEFADNRVVLVLPAGAPDEQPNWDTPEIPQRGTAYLIYTSGSTGHPKGSMVAHDNVLSLLEQTASLLDFGERDIWSFFHSFAFDFSVWEIWGALLSGARLVIVPHWIARSPAEFRQLLENERVTMLNQTPSAFRQLLAHAEEEKGLETLALRWVVFGGEALDLNSLRPWFEMGSQAKLVNMYGITETTVHVSYRPVPARDLSSVIGSWIGRPLPGWQMWLLDAYLRLAPQGAPGEIYVAGVGVTQGYFGRPGLSASRFIPHPFTSRPGQVMYRSGDLGRFRMDGDIEYLGRCDHQIKLRGYRIEPAEIETVLARHPLIAAAVVMARSPSEQSWSTQIKLIAYLVPKDPAEQEDRAARDSDAWSERLGPYLRERLPDYMIPAAYVALAAFPLTANGKLDRKALPEPEPISEDSSRLAEPRNVLEESIARIWSEVLDVGKVDIHANFFDLGGHSLLATQVISRIREAYGIKLPLERLFSSPTVAGLARYLGGLFPPGHETLIPPLAAKDPKVPDTFTRYQERLWRQCSTGSMPCPPAFTSSLRLLGPLSVQDLERSMRQVAQRQKILRATFAPDKDLRQVRITKRQPQPLVLVNRCEKVHPGELSRQLAFMIAVPQPLAFERGLTTLMVREGRDRHLLVIALHPLVGDSPSCELFLSEWAAFYAAALSPDRKHSGFPPLPVQFQDYAHWQRQWLRGSLLDKQRVLARDLASRAGNRLDLPYDRQPPNFPRYLGSECPISLPRRLLDPLDQVGQSTNGGATQVYRSVLAILLVRYSGQSRVTLISSRAGRDRESLKSLIAPLSWHQCFHFELSAMATLSSFLEQGENRDRSADRPELLPEIPIVLGNFYEGHEAPTAVQVRYEQAPGIPHFTGVRESPVRLEPFPVRADLCLTMNASRGEGAFEFNAEVFDADSVRRLGKHWLVLLEGLLNAPDVPISQVSCLATAERHQCLLEWNDLNDTEPKRIALHRLFEGQAAIGPDGIAILGPALALHSRLGDPQPKAAGREALPAVDRPRLHLSYRVLDRKADRLARVLRQNGVRPEDTVAIAVERSIEMLVAVLAVLKAGAAYLPLDPTYPKARLDFMLTHSHAAVLLTQPGLNRRLETGETHIINLPDPEHDAPPATESGRPRLAVHADQPAYVMYTSGSTGVPKGVVMRHRPLANLVLWQLGMLAHVHGNSYPPGRAWRTLQFSAFSFDASCQEFFTTWCSGGTLVLIPDQQRRDALILLRTLQRENIANLFLPFVALQQLADMARSFTTWPHALRHVFASGEQLQITPAIAKLFAQLPGCVLFNDYGPTESHVITSLRLSKDTETWPELPGLGRPIANTRIYLFDRYFQLVPRRAIGEIFIGGKVLSRGYLQRPDLTATRFGPDPHGLPGSRMYRTGDLARFDRHGHIEFMGRCDHQVKYRGFRIEMGEIEAVLSRHPRVGQAVALVREDYPGTKRLVAYIRPVESAACFSAEQPLQEQLTTFLQKRLPEYMVPADYVILEKLPLTATGKVDRRALPAPEHAVHQDRYVSPQSETESALCQIWQDVLKIERIGIEDNFFELGGHSLLATQVASRIRQVLSLEVALGTLFQYQTIAALAKQIENEQAAPTKKLPPLRAYPRDGELFLSFSQQRLWFLDQLDEEKGKSSIFHNIAPALRLTGPLNVPALERSASRIIQRHEALRTTFPDRDGRPFQRIVPPEKVDIPVIDLARLALGAAERLVRQLASGEGWFRFDLAEGPLIRLNLMRIRGKDHVLLVTMHHIISDGWSTEIMIRELAAFYRGYAAGRSVALPELPIQFADFTHWQREWMTGDLLQEQQNYWRLQLQDAPDLLTLPTDRARPREQRFKGRRYHFHIPAGTRNKLERLCQSLEVTVFMVLDAANTALLSRYSGQEDIVVGSPIANRHHREIEPLIGFFVNTLALRANFSGNPTFRQLVARIRQVALDGFAHQDLPFEQVVEAVQPDRGLSHTPIFQAMFVLQNFPIRKLELMGLSMSPLRLDEATSGYDVALLVAMEDNAFACIWEYNADLFYPTTTVHMVRHFLTLLETVLMEPDTKISACSLLQPGERAQVLWEWNDTRTEIPAHLGIHQVFERAAKQTPDTMALVFEDRQWTYGFLNRRAENLARYLCGRGWMDPAHPLVGIYLNRSLKLVEAVLAILKAGGAYLPLDPGYPAHRIETMIQDSRVALILAQDGWAPRLAETGATVFGLSDESDLAPASKQNLPPFPGPAATAYAMYTSGSTGKPKAIQVPHRAVIRLCFGVTYADFDKRGVFLQLAPVSFDAATFEIWGALLHGARLVLFSENIPEAASLGAMLATRHIDTLWLTASLFNLFLEASPQIFRPLRQLLVGGEALSVSHIQSALEQLPQTRIINGYGPTEGTTFTCCYPIPNGALADSVPIGRPLGNTRAYVMDPYLFPVPPGVAGQLLIGGSGLARDYLDRPRRTAHYFIPDPLGDQPGMRLYRSGDLVRHLPTGVLSFLGRIDAQIKLRGFRIEPGEIEAVLKHHEAIGDAVVIPREDLPGERRLVAYLVATEDLEPSTLQDYLKQQLPEYMLPAAYVMLDHLPLTPNGKLNRRALPVPETGKSEQAYVPPRDGVERRLTQIWGELLGVEDLGIYDNFFDRGGHSLLATQAASRIRQSFGCDLPLRHLFAAPTVAALAPKIVNLATTRGEGDPRAMVPQPRPPHRMPLSFAQERLWFLEQMGNMGGAYNILTALELWGLLDPVGLETTATALTDRHETLRTGFSVGPDGTPFQKIMPVTPLQLPVLDLRHLDEKGREDLAQQLAVREAQFPFDLTLGSPFRITLVVLGSGQLILLMTMHHIIADGWSIGVLVKELGAMYGALMSGNVPALPELVIQYADFAHWQRHWLRGEVMARQLRFWKTKLSGAPILSDLPGDNPRPSVQTYGGDFESFQLGRELTQEIKRLADELGATLFMTLLAAFQTFFHRLSRRTDFVIGTDIANRNHEEVEGLIGFFVNQLALRTDLSGNPPFRELLARTRDTLLEAYANQDLPFQNLVAELGLKPTLRHTPLFQVKFLLQNAPTAMPTISGLTMNLMDVKHVPAQYDFLMSMVETSRGLEGSVKYNTDLFNPDTVSQWLTCFTTLLASMVADPDDRLSELAMWSQEPDWMRAQFDDEDMARDELESLLLGISKSKSGI